MSKDPATLFYWNDWYTGTLTMGRHAKGCYMDLLCAQFNNGHLSEEEIKTILGSDFTIWDVLRKKFACDENGLFFNKKLDETIKKRKAFCAVQAEKVKQRWKETKNKQNGNTGVLPIMESGNGIRIENGIENITGADDTLKPIFEKWLAYRRDIRKPVKERSMQASFDRLVKLSDGDAAQAATVIDFCISNGYQGLFAPGGHKTQNTNPTITQQWLD